MKKTTNKLLALLISASILLTVFNAALPTVFATEEITYTNSFKVNVPYSLTDVKGNALTVKIDIADNLVSAITGTDHRRIWWDTFVGDPTGWTDGSITADTSIPLVGYNIQKSDGSSGSSGMATYYSMSAIKDIRFDTSYSIDDEYWIAEPLEFFASSDGVNFNKIDTVRKTVGDAFTRNVCNGMYAQIYDSYTFAEEEDIHFIKVISTIKDENNDFSKQINRIYAIDYTAFPRDEITYKRSLDVTNAYSITDLKGDSSTVKFDIAASLAGVASGITDHRRIWWGTIVDNPTGWTDDGIPADTSVPLIGYNLKTLDGTSGASGAVTYYIPSAVKDIRFDNCYTVDDNNWVAKPLQFYVSSDGINFREIEPETTACGTEFTYPHYLGANSQIYDEYSFLRSDDIHFVRIVSTINAVGNSLTTAVNRIYGIDYNGYEEEIDYERNLDVTNYDSLTDANGESSTVKLDVAEDLPSAAPGLADNARLWWDNGDFVGNATGWSGASTTVPLKAYTIQKADGTKGSSGAIVYRFPDAVKNIRFDTSYSLNKEFYYAKPFEFYASSDGVNYRKLTTECDKVGTDLTRDVFVGMNSQIYDTYTFLESDNIHYIKIVSNIKEDSEYFTKGVNRIYNIDYNTYIDYSTIIMGDANDDGNVDIRDLIHEKVHLSDNTKPLKNFYAADYNRDLVFDTLDIVWLKKALLGLI